MATISKEQAVHWLTQATKDAQPDDLVEIYNELFPQQPTTYDKATANPSAIVDKVIAHIHKGLEVQEILDLWNVIFPKYRKVWFDDEADVIHYNEKTEPISQVD